ncbi:TolC family protein [Chryseobacterium sp.]|uniref:TolC family protein n=1 Tax=Chryseobacterium sp. TaxID=1871047 RepID=UPI00388EDE92
MNFKSKYISLGALAFLLVSCATPQVAELKKAEQLPETLVESTIQPISGFKNVTLKSYFNDPYLIQLFDKSVAANPDFGIAQQRIQIANSYLQRSKKELLPSLEIGAIASGDRYGDYTMEGVGNYDTNLSANITEKQKINRDFTPNYWLGGRSNWEVDLWGRLKSQNQSSLKQFLASEEGLKLLKIELFTDITKLYYQLIALDNRLKIYEENYQLQQRAFEIISAQRVVGKATELAVQQFKAQNKNIKAQIEHLKIEIVSVEQALRTLTGTYEGEIKRGDQLLKSNIDLLNQSYDVETIIHSRHDVLSKYYELEASQANAKAAKAAFYPRLNIDAKVGLNSFSSGTFFNVGSMAAQILGGLMVPIFNQGQLKHNFNVANAEQEIAFLNYQKSVTSAYNELYAILKQMDIYESALKLKNEEVEHLDLAVEVSNELYITGYANYLELINSQKNKLQADLDFLQFQEENSQNNVILFKALGGIIN